MKNLYLFAFEATRSYGGMKDFVGRFESYESIRKFLREHIASSIDLNLKLVNSWDEIQIIEITDQEIRILLSDVPVSDFLECEENNWEYYKGRMDADDLKSVGWLNNKFSRICK